MSSTVAFTAEQRAAFRAIAKTTAASMLREFMKVGRESDATPLVIFGTMVHQLAFARLLEDQLVKSLVTCPDKELARAIDELATEVALDLTSELKARGRP
jgi:hypothetical protein